MDEDIDITSDLIDETDSLGTIATENVVESATEVVSKADAAKSLRDQISSAIKGEDLTPNVASQDGVNDAVEIESDPITSGEATEASAASVRTPDGVSPEVFNTLPAETQEYLARTMDSIKERETQLSSMAYAEQLISPRRQGWALNGMTEQQALGQLFALSDFAGSDPQGFIKYFAQQSGVSLEDIIFSEDNIVSDPEVTALKNEVQALKGQLSGFTTDQQRQAHDATVNEIVSFFDEKDSNGSKLRPYAEEIGQAIMPFIQASMQKNPNAPRQRILQEAYENACWGVPSVRVKLQEASKAQSEAERLKASSRKAATARLASSSVASSVPSSPNSSVNDVGSNASLKDTIRASIAAVS